jgi:hypothetical protein
MNRTRDAIDPPAIWALENVPNNLHFIVLIRVHPCASVVPKNLVTI